ncbi:MAG: D-glycero-alpha-D-manno-heptose-1,7-bisphosphate 7-phosphatase [Rufibacter sp.]
MNKAIFLDRDGVLNVERGEYTWRLEDFEVAPGVGEALALLKKAGFIMIVITNQAGIAKGLYTKAQVLACHQKLQEATGHLIDGIYLAPGHPSISESLSRKPDSLMIEKAIARFNIDPRQSWFVGDQLRDLQAAGKCHIKGVLIGEWPGGTYMRQAQNLLDAARKIVFGNL